MTANSAAIRVESAPRGAGQMAYRPDIDGLRAIAILSVALFHAWPHAAPGGFVGVDIFFVISGFLITSIIQRDLAEGRFRFSTFYAARIRRIFPALLLVLLATLALGWVILLGGEYRALGRHVGAGAGFVSNWLLWSEAGYFDVAAEQKPLLHLWSLGVEEQFYLLWPLLLVCASRWRWDIRLVIAAVAAASFSANLIEVASDPSSAFYLPQCRFWELMLGAGLTALPVGDRRSREALAIAGSALIAISLVVVKPEYAFPGYWAVAPALGATLLVAAGPMAFINRRLLASTPMVWLGLRSYPLYLWHWPLLFFANRYIGSDKAIALIRYRSLALLVALALAWATHALVEKGVRRAYQGRPRLVVAGLCAGIIAIALVGLTHWPRQSSNSSLVALAKLDAFAVAQHADTWREKICFFVPGENPDEPAAFKRNHCDGGPSPRRPFILLIGDSHAAALYPGIAAVFGDRFTIGQLTVAFCVPLIENPIALGNVATNARCRQDNNFVFERVAAEKPDLIIASAHFLGYETSVGTLYPDYVQAAAEGLRQLQRRSGSPILLVGQSPTWNRALPYALADYLRTHPGPPPMMGTFDLDTRIFETDSRLKAISWGEKISYVSLIDALCAKGACRVTVDGEFPDNVVAYDANHLSEGGSGYVAQTILQPWIAAHLQGAPAH